MKIDIKNMELLDGKKKLKLKKAPKYGIVVAFLVMGIWSAVNSSNTPEVTTPATFEEIDEDSVSALTPISASLDDVNNLNIILNDNDCGNTFFDDVCAELESDGIQFTRTSCCENIANDNCTVISLDMQYSSGPNTLVIGSYDNNRTDNSDALALAMNAGLYENGFFTEDILCGKTGYRETENGGITERVPTTTEEALQNNSSTTFTTISFGTQNANAELTAKSIESGLTRYVSYINNNDIGEDLIYRASAGDTLNGLADKFSTTPDDLNRTNNRDYDEQGIQSGESMINPTVDSISEFDSKNPINLSAAKTIWSK